MIWVAFLFGIHSWLELGQWDYLIASVKKQQHINGKPEPGAESHYEFAVPFHKMLTLHMLWRAQFLLDFYAVFCIHQILILLPL